MIRRTMTTVRDLRNWVDSVTCSWDDRTDADVETIVDVIRSMDRPAWGTDWREFLDSLPENLADLLDDPNA